MACCIGESEYFRTVLMDEKRLERPFRSPNEKPRSVQRLPAGRGTLKERPWEDADLAGNLLQAPTDCG